MKVELKKAIQNNSKILPISFYYFEVFVSHSSESTKEIGNKVGVSKIHQTEKYRLDRAYQIQNINLPMKLINEKK